MRFSNNNMLCFYVLAAFLAIGDCSLSPIVRPFLSLLDAPRSDLADNGNPSRSSYRIHGSLPPSVSVPSDRWGGGKIDPPVIIPKVTTLDGGISSKTPVSKVIWMDEWNVRKPEVSVKYLNRMGKIDGDKLGWTVKSGNDVNKVSGNPLKKSYAGMDKGWIIEGSGEVDWVEKPVIVKPLKGGSRKMMLYGDLGEDAGLMRYGSNELGSSEQDGGDPGHDTDDQADHDRRIKTYWRKSNIADSKEDMERIVIIENPISARSHASRKHILRRGYKMARNSETACLYCNEAILV